MPHQQPAPSGDLRVSKGAAVAQAEGRRTGRPPARVSVIASLGDDGRFYLEAASQAQYAEADDGSPLYCGHSYAGTIPADLREQAEQALRAVLEAVHDDARAAAEDAAVLARAQALNA